ncbi:hypothetical protein [Rhizobium sp. MHM7A]|uniref:hypothetical protein n=1 Tax=Rhizobium sp. MHM7A TaxID=2583233 RepID=UPI001106A3C2|nr:hypothetical protein [Rhizobium sp. MHM7A]TLX08845.1 hypothetical protein FFR93_27485 [Rhizobium sp. MHM7A]
MNHFPVGRWLRWLIIDHLLLIVLILMLATVFSVPLINGDPARSEKRTIAALDTPVADAGKGGDTHSISSER